jgi:hypothetical protein
VLQGRQLRLSGEMSGAAGGTEAKIVCRMVRREKPERVIGVMLRGPGRDLPDAPRWACSECWW